MTRIKDQLFEAFKQDHALLGKAFYELGQRIADADEPGAQIVAEQIAREAGAHIAFEEQHFYPALLPFLSEDQLSTMNNEHAAARKLLRDVLALAPGALKDSILRASMVDSVEAAQTHVAECGELFGAMGSLDEQAQAQLMSKLELWRKRAPNWLDLAPA